MQVGFPRTQKVLLLLVAPKAKNANDNTLEGLRCKKFPAFSVQYHPEASPGPHDSAYLFDSFITLMADGDY